MLFEFRCLPLKKKALIALNEMNLDHLDKITTHTHTHTYIYIFKLKILPKNGVNSIFT